MKAIRNSLHTAGRGHECLIKEINGKKVKFTYEAYNAVEKCNTEIFDGYKWNHFLCMLDLGMQPDTTAYILSENYRKTRVIFLFQIAENMCKEII